MHRKGPGQGRHGIETVLKALNRFTLTLIKGVSVKPPRCGLCCLAWSWAASPRYLGVCILANVVSWRLDSPHDWMTAICYRAARRRCVRYWPLKVAGLLQFAHAGRSPGHSCRPQGTTVECLITL